MIHAYEVLQLYARQHADTAGRVRVVGDEDITENNGVTCGKRIVPERRTNECCCSESGGTCRSVHDSGVAGYVLGRGRPLSEFDDELIIVGLP